MAIQRKTTNCLSLKSEPKHWQWWSQKGCEYQTAWESIYWPVKKQTEKPHHGYRGQQLYSRYRINWQEPSSAKHVEIRSGVWRSFRGKCDFGRCRRASVKGGLAEQTNVWSLFTKMFRVRSSYRADILWIDGLSSSSSLSLLSLDKWRAWSFPNGIWGQ